MQKAPGKYLFKCFVIHLTRLYSLFSWNRRLEKICCLLFVPALNKSWSAAPSSLRTLHRPRPKQSLQTRLGPGCEEENAEILWTRFLIPDAFFIPFQWETKLELFETNLVKCLKHHLDRFHRQYKFVNIKQKIRAGAGGSTDSATQSYLRDWIGYKYIYLRPCQPLLCGAIVKQRDRDLRGLRFLQQMPNKDRTNNCIIS